MKKSRLTAKFLEELERVHIISSACEAVGLSRQTVYRWMSLDLKFKEKVDKAIEMGIESVIDLAESKLISNINDRKQKAIEYFLSNHSKRYRSKKPMSEQQEKFVPITHVYMDTMDEKMANEMRNKFKENRKGDDIIL